MRRTSDTAAELWRQKCMEKEATQSGDFTIEGDEKEDKALKKRWKYICETMTPGLL